MFDAGTLTFREFSMNEPHPLATIQNAVLEFLRERDDVVVFGAQAVNAYVSEPRMTQDIDLISTKAPALAEALKRHLHHTFHIAVRIRKVAKGRGFRLFQIRMGGNRHLVDIRAEETLPEARRIADVLVMSPPELLVYKLIAYHRRRGRPKAGTDWRDIAMLLLTFPELKDENGEVAKRLRQANVEPEILALWSDFVGQEIFLGDEDDEF